MVRAAVEEKVMQIVSVIKRDYAVREDVGLFDGSAGVSLFLFLASQYFSCKKTYNTAFGVFEQTLLQIEKVRQIPYNFVSGISGIGWAIEFLVQKGLIDEKADELLVDIDKLLFQAQRVSFANQQYDFLYQGGGSLLYFLKRIEGGSIYSDRFEKLIEESIENLLKVGIENDNTLKWPSSITKTKQLTYEIGMAHGMAAVLTVFSKALTLKKFQHNHLWKLKFEKIKNYILSQKINFAQHGSHFPTTSLESEKGIAAKSRLAWCRGDVGISRGLMLAGVNTNDSILYNMGLSVLESSINRRRDMSELIFDASVCHGSSGVLVSYIVPERLNIRNVDYSKVQQYWLGETFNMMNHDTGLAGYKYYTPKLITPWSNRYSILEGVSGVGLVLLAYLNNEFSDWTEVLLYE